MTLIRSFDDLPEHLRGGAVSIGNFDGVHLGHARLIERLRAMARRLGGPAMVFTFDPHPAHVLRRHDAPVPLCTAERKTELLARLGVDAVFAYPTERQFLSLTAREFFEQVVVEKLGARGLVEGPNFTFGRGREGDVALLRRFCDEAAVAFEVPEAVEDQHAMVSSTRIRELVSEGSVELANRLLTAPYRIGGTVSHGAGRGATLGYPTANLEQIGCLLPADGIYAGRAEVGGKPWPAAISVGSNPTFDEDHRKVEIYLLDYRGDLYQRRIEVDFLARLREIKRFESAEALVAQMDRDVEQTRRIAAGAAAS